MIVKLRSKTIRQRNDEPSSIGVRAEGAIVVVRRKTLSQVVEIMPRPMCLLNASDIIRQDKVAIDSGFTCDPLVLTVHAAEQGLRVPST